MVFSVIIFFFIVNFIENNILTPNITGDYVSLNPLFTIISLIAGAILWGLPGMFLVIPFIAMLKIVADNSTSMQPYAYILGVNRNNKHALTFGKIKGLFVKKKTVEKGS
jgi:predicted PurR-regulated permease PerM